MGILSRKGALIGGLLLLIFLEEVTSICPTKCSCYLDHKGRMAVSCADGGLVGPITLENVNTSTEVLRITAPETNMNMLTMSPAFQQFPQLEEIHITRSNIPILGQHFFWGLKKLDILNLSQNSILQPLDHNFRGLSNLKELYLDDNNISSLPSGTFRYLLNLKILSIQRNRIREMTPRIFLEIGKLRVLKLSGNNLGELNPDVFKDVQELRVLECRGCALKRIDDMFHLLPYLSHLDLGNNLIQYIVPKEFKDLQNLRQLKLDGNHITTVGGSTFSVQTELKKLTLAKNRITFIDSDAFSNLYNLTDLDLGYNKIEYFEENTFEPISATLQKLVLSGNHIRTNILKATLSTLAIKELHVVECGLADLPSNIFPDSITTLNLACNYLSTLSCIAQLPELHDLDISKNRFRGLNEKTAKRLEIVNRLKLEGNPWACDLCHIVPLLERTNRSAAIRDIKCASPYTAEGKLLSHLQLSDLTWCNTATYESGDANFFFNGEENGIGLIAAGSSVLLLFLSVVGILAILCYSRRHAAKYYTHEEKLAAERDSIFEGNQSPLFGSDKELCFKFPLEPEEKRISISTIDEIKKEHAITNGT